MWDDRRLLERVLSKKRDHASQFTYLAELGQASAMGVSNVEHFWTSMMIQVGNEFANLHSVSPFIERAFQSEFPKLLRLMTELSTRVMQQSNPEGYVRHRQQFDNRDIPLYETPAESPLTLNTRSILQLRVI